MFHLDLPSCNFDENESEEFKNFLERVNLLASLIQTKRFLNSMKMNRMS